MSDTENSNACIWFVERHLSEGRAEKVAFREATAGRQLTYGALASGSARVADALLRLGLRREERLACLLLDRIEYPLVFWGAIRAGIVPVPLNTLLASEVYGHILRDSRATAIVVSPELWPVVKPALEGSNVEHVIFAGENAPEGTIGFEAFLEGASPSDPVDVGGDEVAFWLYSSGSTGQPKGVRHVHAAMQVTAQTYGAEVLGIREDDVVFSVAKIFFAYGLGNAMSFPMSVGATTILFDGRPTPESVVDILAKEQPTLFCGVPTLFAATCAHLDQVGVPEGQLRLCISAGEALPEDIGLRWRDHWGVDILDGVGSTEMLHIFLSNRVGDVVYGTSGVAVPGYDLRCVTEDGAEVQPGEVGELLVRGESAAEGYWNKRDKSRSTFEGEWTRTGDKYEITDDGRYVYCGRTDDMFKVSGIWVSPFEVEQALVSHPSVLEAAVVACPDDAGLLKPKAFVVLKAAIDGDVAQVLKDHVKDRVGMWKYPRWVEVTEELPKTATGKIQRFKLRETA